jgi:hypothetical protein
MTRIILESLGLIIPIRSRPKRGISLQVELSNGIQNLEEFDFGPVEIAGISRIQILHHNKADCGGGLLRGNWGRTTVNA